MYLFFADCAVFRSSPTIHYPDWCHVNKDRRNDALRSVRRWRCLQLLRRLFLSLLQPGVVIILVRTFTHTTLLPYVANLTFKRYQCCEAVHEDKCRSHHVITRTDDSSGNKSPKASTDHVQVATQAASPASHIAQRCAPPPAAPEIASRTPLQDKVSRSMCYHIGTLRSLLGTCCSSSLPWM